MKKSYTLYQIDSFTKDKFSGNPAGVITNAEGLSDFEMQKIARELNNSETAFVFSSNSEEYDVQVRFFTPTHEVPICGHATIAAHYALALDGKFTKTRILQKTGAGILPVEIVREKEDYKIIMTQGNISFGDILVGQEKEMLLEALHIEHEDLLKEYPLQVVSTGHSKVMVGIKKEETLHNLQPDHGALTKLSKKIQCNGYYIFTVDPEKTNADCLIHGRMFAPAIGIQEDPVTGNANGPLGAYLVHNDLVKHNDSVFTFRAMQGEAIHRAGIIEVAVKVEKEEPIEVKISGNAVVAFQSELVMES